MNWDQHERDLQERGRIDALERRVTNLERIMGRYMSDIFDTIAAALTAKNSGDNPTYDAHLSTLDATTQQLGATETDQGARITAIENGLAKIAAAVNPPASGGTTTTAADPNAANSGSDSASAPASGDAASSSGASTSDPAAQPTT